MLTPPASRIPLFSAHALSRAAAAAADRPRRQRRPFLHGLVIFASDRAHLLAYAQNVLFAFAARGIDVFLQTDVSTLHSSPHPIALENIDDIIATSPADFFVLITERDVGRNTVQVRAGLRFVDRHIDKHASLVLESWAVAVAREHAQQPHPTPVLEMNPNIVTSKHIDFLLQQHPLLKEIRPAYAALARLVDTTHKWLEEDHHHHHSAPPAAEPPPAAARTPPPRPAHPSDTPTRPREPSPPPPDPAPAPALPQARMDELARSALRQGMRAVLARNEKRGGLRDGGDGGDSDDDLLSRPYPTFRWLRRSAQLRARVLRGQLLVQTLHSQLVATFPQICSAPVSRMPGGAPGAVYSVPSEAHRQRLLRELNFLVARFEELGARLSRRPRTHPPRPPPRRRRRRRRFPPPAANPWAAYIARARAAAATSAPHPAPAPQAPPAAPRCPACHSPRLPGAASCRACRAPGAPPFDGAPALAAADGWAARLRDAIATAARQHRPWIFAPAPLPPPPPAGALEFGRARAASSSAEPAPRPVPVRAQAGPFAPRASRLSPDLLDAFQALAVGDAGANGGGGGLFEPRSLESKRGPLGNLQSFPLPNGHDGGGDVAAAMSPGRFAQSPPSRSPDGFGFRRRGGDEFRPGSLDSSILGNSLTHRVRGRQWLAEKRAGRDLGRTEVGGREIPMHALAPPQQQHRDGAPDFTLGSSPPLFGGLNGAFAGNGYVPDAMQSLKTGARGGGGGGGGGERALGVNGVRPPATAGYEHFAGGPAANGGLPAHFAHPAPSHMEELAVGSIEAPDLPARFMGGGGGGGGGGAGGGGPPRPPFAPAQLPLAAQDVRSSLEELAAASDAANGGHGAATRESMRAVLALRNELDPPPARRGRGGAYGLF